MTNSETWIGDRSGDNDPGFPVQLLPRGQDVFQDESLTVEKSTALL